MYVGYMHANKGCLALVSPQCLDSMQYVSCYDVDDLSMLQQTAAKQCLC